MDAIGLVMEHLAADIVIFPRVLIEFLSLNTLL